MTRKYARDAGAPDRPQVRSIWVPEGSRRTPLVMVEVQRGALRLTFAVARLRGGGWDVRPPRGPDGEGVGVWMPAKQRARLGEMILRAVQADPHAVEALRSYG